MGETGVQIDAAFLRHGETVDVVAGLISGWRDVALTPAGKEMAGAAAERLARLGLRRIVTSDLRRARETAAIVARVLHVPVESDPRWRERCWGEREGTPHRPTPNHGNTEPPRGGESLAELRERVRAALHEVPPRTLVVTHAGPLRCVREAACLPALEVTPGEFLDLTRPRPLNAPPAEIPVEALVLTPGDFAGQVCYVTVPADMDALGEDKLVLLQRCDKAVAVAAMGRAAAAVNLTMALTAHLSHGRHSPRPYAVALAWPEGLPRQGEHIRLRVLKRPPKPRRVLWPDVPPLPAPCIADVGGKAAGLFLLRASGFRVPPFEVIDAASLGAWEARGNLLAGAQAWVGRLEAAGGHVRWAVRSSADVEDATDQPLSGTFESRLGLAGAEVPNAVAEVVASARGSEVQARLASGSLAAPPRMAVVVQRMVERPRLAGAAFVPAPDDPGVLLIEAQLGTTGEALMDGRHGPDVSARFGAGGEAECVARADGSEVDDRLRAMLEEVAAGAAAVYRTTGRGDLEFAIDGAGALWWLQARMLPAAVEVVDRRGYSPAALAYYQALAFRVHEANRTEPAYFRLVPLADGRFGYSVGIRERDRIFHARLEREPSHLKTVTAFGWEAEARMAALASALDGQDPERVLDELVLHSAVQLPFSIPMEGARMDRFRSEPIDGLAGPGLLEQFLSRVLEATGDSLSLEEALGLLRQPLDSSTRLEVLRSLRKLVEGAAEPGDEDVLAHVRFDLRDLPDLSPAGMRRLRERVIEEVELYRRSPDGPERLRQTE